jgi:transcriptional regulator with XRE-family HTH domain
MGQPRVTMIPIEDAEDLADTLQLLRILAGRTQRDVAGALHLSPGRLGDYERATRGPQAKTLLRILDELGWKMMLVPRKRERASDGLDGDESAVQESEHDDRFPEAREDRPVHEDQQHEDREDDARRRQDHHHRPDQDGQDGPGVEARIRNNAAGLDTINIA